MKNEPEITIKGSPESITVYENSDGFWIITDHKTETTTQAESKVKALIMLADALSHTSNSSLDELITYSETVFTPNSEK